MPARLADRAPRVVEDDAGNELWVFDGSTYPQVGLNAIAGRPKTEWSMEPARFDEMRRGCWDPAARLADMDLDGVLASLCFPSLIAGFAGTVFARTSDPELGLACVRAWNDWMHEEWAGAAPDRLLANQLPWLGDPEIAAAEVRANAASGRCPGRCRARSPDRHPTPTVAPREVPSARRAGTASVHRGGRCCLLHWPALRPRGRRR